KAVREMKATQIEDYFELITDQVATFAEDRMIIVATRRFKEGFNNVTKELHQDETKIAHENQALDAYLKSEYLPRLNKNLDQKATLDRESTHNANARALQYLYIAANPHPVGKKDLLDHALNDSTSYSKAHKNFHPVIRKYLETFGYYDIFIVDNETG